MARFGVSYEDIVSAANELIGQDKSVTIENVRGILGTGSISTINNHLRKWKQTQSSTPKVSAKENLPEELVSLIKGLWERVNIQAEEKFVPQEENYLNKIATLNQELEKYKSNNQRWQKLFNQWQEEKTELANDKLMLEQSLEFSYKENTFLADKQDALLQQLSDKQERIDELHRLHKQTQENLEHFRQATREQRILDQQQYEQERLQLQSEIKILNEQTVMQREKLFVLQQENKSLQQSYQMLEKQNGESQVTMQQLAHQIQELEKAKAEHQHSSNHWQHQYRESQTIIENKNQVLVDSQTESKLLSQQLANIKPVLTRIQEDNKLLTHGQLILEQEKIQLENYIKQMQKGITV
jgi:chromosome segregation ATPase